jgi:hypothetical protein
MNAILPELYLIDLDCTLLDTNRAVDVLISVSEEAGVDKDLLLQSQAASEASGRSFDIIAYLGKQGITGRALGSLFDDFVERGRNEDLLYPDVEPFLEALDMAEQESLILAYGDPRWQLNKFAATRLANRAHLITPRKDKGNLIADWQTVDGGYVLATTTGVLAAANTVTLVDDRADSFTGLPGNCRGFLKRQPDSETTSSLVGEIPENVTIISSLRELIRYIRAT